MDGTSINVLNLETICRTCLEKNGTTSIFGENNLIQSKLSLICNIQVNKYDGCPQSLCCDCTQKINDAFLFREKCEKSEQFLEAYKNKYEQAVEIKTEDNSNDRELTNPVAVLELINNGNCSETDCLSKNESDIFEDDNTLTKEIKEDQFEDTKKPIQKPERKVRPYNFKNVNKKAINVETINENGEKIYQCYFCKTIYETQKELIEHYRTHNSEKPFVCPQCGHGFKRPFMLTDHLSIHLGIKPFECDHCTKSYASKYSLSKHVLSAHKEHKKEKKEIIKIEPELETVTKNGDKIFQCFFCKTVHKTQDELIKHYKEHDQERPYVCSICGKQYSRPSHLNAHLLQHQKIKPHRCELCGNSYSDRYSLLKHLRKIHGKNKEELNIDRWNNDIVHIETTQENGEKIYVCYICKNEYENQQQLLEHYQTHDPTRPYICPQCGQRFKRPHVLNDHVLFNHLGVKKPFECDVCHKEYSCKTNLTVHYRTHTGDYPYKCEDCNKKFKHSTELKMHRRVHTKEKPFMCPYCGKMMSMSSHLAVHIRAHTDERRHKCTLCDKAFVRSECLKTHMLTHTGVRNYPCKVCGKAFYRPSALKLHSMIHTDERPHVCKYCGKGFIQRQAMNTHMNTHI